MSKKLTIPTVKESKKVIMVMERTLLAVGMNSLICTKQVTYFTWNIPYIRKPNALRVRLVEKTEKYPEKQ